MAGLLFILPKNWTSGQPPIIFFCDSVQRVSRFGQKELIPRMVLQVSSLLWRLSWIFVIVMNMNVLCHSQLVNFKPDTFYVSYQGESTLIPFNYHDQYVPPLSGARASSMHGVFFTEGSGARLAHVKCVAIDWSLIEKCSGSYEYPSIEDAGFEEWFEGAINYRCDPDHIHVGTVKCLDSNGCQSSVWFGSSIGTCSQHHNCSQTVWNECGKDILVRSPPTPITTVTSSYGFALTLPNQLWGIEPGLGTGQLNAFKSGSGKWNISSVTTTTLAVTPFIVTSISCNCGVEPNWSQYTYASTAFKFTFGTTSVQYSATCSPLTCRGYTQQQASGNCAYNAQCSFLNPCTHDNFYILPYIS